MKQLNVPPDLHGIPGWERNFDLAQALRRAGFHVLVFHYSGSWGNDGTYSLAHILEDSGPWLTGTSGEALWQEARADSARLCMEPLAPRLANKPLLCIRGARDRDTPPSQHCDPLIRAIRKQGSPQLEVLTLPTDHLSSDYRPALADLVTKFLTSQAEAR